VEHELDLDACRRADGKEPVSLLDGVPGFVERPQIVVADAVPVLRVADRADMPVGTTDNADDPYSVMPTPSQVPTRQESTPPAADATIGSTVRRVGYNTRHPAEPFSQSSRKDTSP
jgi:hypothetical protein